MTLPHDTIRLSAEQVVAVGATNLQSLTSDLSILQNIPDNALILTFSTAHVAVPFAACMEFL